MTTHLRPCLSWIGGLLALVLSTPAAAVLEIEITRGVQSALPIAVVPFTRQPGLNPPQDVSQVIAADLARSGQFRLLEQAAHPSSPGMDSRIDHASWRARGIEHLVVGRVLLSEPGRYRVEFRLYDLIQQRQIVGRSIPANEADLRRAAHQVSDYVYEALLGRPGAFNTQVAYVTTERSGEGKAEYTLQIADADGYGPQTVLRSPRPIMSPAWAPDAARLAYVSFENGRSEIYVQELKTGQKRLVARESGINGAPAWSPDGRRLALTLSRDGNPEIYILDLRSLGLTRLTDNRAIDTEPLWSPDGRHVLFTSDRSGSAQIYRVPARGGRAERLTFDGSFNADASISPDGRRLALVNGDGGRFRIALYDMDRRRAVSLTDGPLDEAPAFAPNGAMILYAAQERGRGVLAAVSEDGGVHQLLVLPGAEVREPAWSPLPK